MGVYYSMISQRTRKIGSYEVAYSNFHGKAPPIFGSDKNRSWNTFCTKAGNNADTMQGRVQFVMYAQTIGDMAKYGEATIARWNGQAMLHDGFWDNNTVGTARKINGRWTIEWRDGFNPATGEFDEPKEEEWSPETTDYCDVGSIHHY